MNPWKLALSLNSERQIVAGDEQNLVDAVRHGCDLRIGTEFIHNEHIDVRSPCDERIREVAEFGVTFLLDDRWAAGIMSLRQPVGLPEGFGQRPSMSFFLYNQDGKQAIARPHLDGMTTGGARGPSAPQTPEGMPKYHTEDSWDDSTNAPSSNFIYNFDHYQFFVRDDWREVLAHDRDGTVMSGSVNALAAAFTEGREVKIGVAGLCDDLSYKLPPMDHEVFVEVGSCYYYTQRKLFICGTHPVVRVAPDIPMRYRTQAWDFGWLVARTDGLVAYRRCDPYTLRFTDCRQQAAIRWFVR